RQCRARAMAQRVAAHPRLSLRGAHRQHGGHHGMDRRGVVVAGNRSRWSRLHPTWSRDLRPRAGGWDLAVRPQPPLAAPLPIRERPRPALAESGKAGPSLLRVIALTRTALADAAAVRAEPAIGPYPFSTM